MPPGTPQRNGVSKRHNRTLLDMVRYDVSYRFTTIVFGPSKSVETMPYELWFGKKPKLSFLKVWGIDAYVKKFQPDMLKSKSEKCVFIRIPKRNCWVHLLSQIRRQDLCCSEWIVSKEGVSLERSEWEESRT